MQEDQTQNAQQSTHSAPKAAPKRRWIWIAGIAAAVILTLGVGAMYGSAFTGSAKAAAGSVSQSNNGYQAPTLNQSSQSASGSVDATQSPSDSKDSAKSDTGSDATENSASDSKDSAQSGGSTQSGSESQDVYDSLTVTSVNGATITAKDVNGNTVTIQTTSSTVYTQNDAVVSASAVKQGLKIDVRGTKNSDGSVTATKIEIG